MHEMNGKWQCCYSAVVRVELADGAYHEDVGCGIGDAKQKGAAVEKAKKESVTDATKRALRLFGPALGNSVYDKDHMKSLKGSRTQKGSVFTEIDKIRSNTAAVAVQQQHPGPSSAAKEGQKPQQPPHAMNDAQQQKQLRLLQQQKQQEEAKRKLAANSSTTPKLPGPRPAPVVRGAGRERGHEGGHEGGQKRALTDSSTANQSAAAAVGDLGDLNFDDFPSCSQLDREVAGSAGDAAEPPSKKPKG